MPARARKHRRHNNQYAPPRKVSVFKEVDQTPSRLSGNSCPVNLNDAKEQFLKHGILPHFKLKNPSPDNVDKELKRKRCQTKFDHFREAKAILELIKRKFGDGCKYIDQNYGDRIDFVQGTEILADYLRDNSCEGEMTIYWTPQLECTAKMMWHGPNLRYNRPEMRRYSLVIKNSTENAYLRQHGIQCLANHEIGTHYLRMINDGLQPWFSDRKKFGLRAMRSRESAASEEGLAAINTLYSARYKYLWGPALTYYTACMASELSFRELYDHLECYMSDPEQRWKTCMRVKRHIHDPNAHGGSGADQCYFEGVVEILRNIDNIDFALMYAGKLCVDELNRVRRVARLDCVKLPRFLHDIEKYKHFLRHMAYVNGLGPKPERRSSLNAPARRGPATVSTPQIKATGGLKLTPTPPTSKSRSTSRTNRRKLHNHHAHPGRSVTGMERSSASVVLERAAAVPGGEEQTTLVRIPHNTGAESLPDSTEDDDEVATCPPGNSYAALNSPSQPRLLDRPKSTPNKICSGGGNSSSGNSGGNNSSGNNNRIDWFGMLERKWDS